MAFNIFDSKTGLSRFERKMYDLSMKEGYRGLKELYKSKKDICLLSTLSDSLVNRPDDYTTERLHQFINLAECLQVEHTLFRSPSNNIDDNLEIIKELYSNRTSADAKPAEPQEEDDTPSTIITGSFGYLHYDNDVYTISLEPQEKRFTYERHYDLDGIVEIVKCLMTLMIVSGMDPDELQDDLMQAFKDSKEGESE